VAVNTYVVLKRGDNYEIPSPSNVNPLKRGENDEIPSPSIEALKCIHTAKEARILLKGGEKF